jgi:hypothetical protein
MNKTPVSPSIAGPHPIASGGRFPTTFTADSTNPIPRPSRHRSAPCVASCRDTFHLQRRSRDPPQLLAYRLPLSRHVHLTRVSLTIRAPYRACGGFDLSKNAAFPVFTDNPHIANGPPTTYTATPHAREVALLLEPYTAQA